MTMRLNTSDATFAGQFTELLGQKREVSADVDHAVADIVAAMKRSSSYRASLTALILKNLGWPSLAPRSKLR